MSISSPFSGKRYSKNNLFDTSISSFYNWNSVGESIFYQSGGGDMATIYQIKIFPKNLHKG